MITELLLRLPDFQLETERLILRPPRAEDFDPWAAFHADATTMRYMGGVQPKAHAWRSLMMVAGCWALSGFAMFSVIEKSSGNWVGRLGPWMPEGWPGTEIGWGLLSSACGHGYAVEGATAAIDWAFARLDWSEVIHCIDPENKASQAVATRLGSVNLGPGKMPAPFEDVKVDIWSQSRAEWFARRKQERGA